MMKYLWDFKKHFYVMFSLRVEFGILKSVFPKLHSMFHRALSNKTGGPTQHCSMQMSPSKISTTELFYRHASPDVL